MPPPHRVRSPSVDRRTPSAYAHSLLETLDSLTPEEKRVFDKLAELDRAEGKPAESE